MQMKSLFNTEQEASTYREKHQLFVMTAHPVNGTGKWALSYPIEAHVTVIDSTGMVVKQWTPRPRFG